MRLSLGFFGVAIVIGLAIGRLTPLAFIWIVILGFAIWLPAKRHLNAGLRFSCYGVFLLLAVMMSNHFMPGFNNLPIFQGIQFSLDSTPFTMYLNFDKTLVGLFLLLFYVRGNQPQKFTWSHFFTAFKVLAILLMLLIPLALVVRYVRIDPKFPELGWLWTLNNLFFVCLAEEGLFRGFIQKGMAKLLPKRKLWPLFSIFVAAVLFGLAHYRGGLIYVLFATVAGLFYGYAYYKTNRLESAILVHFGFNLVHFLFFSYPALAK